MKFNKLFLITGLATAMTLLSSGCAYRADLAQGNFVEQENGDKLHYGMSAEQVRFILGTPMLVDPFDNSRWYYVHYLREGWGEPQIKNLVVLFNGATLVDISGDFTKSPAFNEQSDNISKITLSSILEAAHDPQLEDLDDKNKTAEE